MIREILTSQYFKLKVSISCVEDLKIITVISVFFFVMVFVALLTKDTAVVTGIVISMSLYCAIFTFLFFVMLVTNTIISYNEISRLYKSQHTNVTDILEYNGIVPECYNRVDLVLLNINSITELLRTISFDEGYQYVSINRLVEIISETYGDNTVTIYAKINGKKHSRLFLKTLIYENKVRLKE